MTNNTFPSHRVRSGQIHEQTMASDLYMTVCGAFLYFLIPPSCTGTITSFLLCTLQLFTSQKKLTSKHRTLYTHNTGQPCRSDSPIVSNHWKKKNPRDGLSVQTVMFQTKIVTQFFFCGYVTLFPGYALYFLSVWVRQEQEVLLSIILQTYQ